MKFGQLILRRIVKIIATKCQILRQKCTRWGSLQCSLRPLAGFKGPTSKERGIGREGKGRGRKRRAG